MAFHDKIDWTGVDWTRTNAEIAASLGGIRRETVSRERVRLGHAKVYPRPSDRIGELERENAELREKIATMTASPIMDAVRAQPGLAHVKGTDAELLRWVLRSRHGWEPGQVRWSHVCDMAGHGSTVGHALCVAVGVDPNETAPDDDGENCPRCGSLLEHEREVGGVEGPMAEFTDPWDRWCCRVIDGNDEAPFPEPLPEPWEKRDGEIIGARWGAIHDEAPPWDANIIPEPRVEAVDWRWELEEDLGQGDFAPVVDGTATSLPLAIAAVEAARADRRAFWIGALREQGLELDDHADPT